MSPLNIQPGNFRKPYSVNLLTGCPYFLLLIFYGIIFCILSPDAKAEPRFSMASANSYFTGMSFSVEAVQASELLEGEHTKGGNKRRFIANSVVAGGYLAYLVYGFIVFWPDAEYHRFIVSAIDNREQWTYAGGSDKFSHAFGSYFITRTCAWLYNWSGMNERAAVWRGFWLSQLFLTLGEVEDGFTIEYGFDTVDILANVLGGLLGVSEVYWPVLDKFIDFKIAYWPSDEYYGRSNFTNIAEDYSGQSYYFVFHFETLLRSHKSYARKVLRYLEWYIGFRSQGYMPAYDYVVSHPRAGFTPFERKRKFEIGVSLNVLTILDVLFHRRSNDDRGPWGSVAYQSARFFFTYYQHPLRGGYQSDISSETMYYRQK